MPRRSERSLVFLLICFAFVCLLLIPILERFTKTKQERLAAKMQ